MQNRNRNPITPIHIEGALLSVDLLQDISKGGKILERLNPETYHRAPGEKVNIVINPKTVHYHFNF